MSLSLSGGKQVIKFANTSNRGQVCLFDQFKMENVHIEFWQDLHHYCLP